MAGTAEAADAALHFGFSGPIQTVEAYGSGNINDTFLVRPGADKPFILQRLNRRVFPRPELVMQNLRACTAHVAGRLAQGPVAPGRRWEIPEILRARDGRDCWIASDGSFWRALTFIQGAVSFDLVRDRTHAGEVGFALGTFHRLIGDLPLEALSDTLEGFHITPGYLRHYDAVVANLPSAASPEVRHAMRFIATRRASAAVLEAARAAGRLRPRPMHGDPKVNNVMIDAVSGQAVSFVDLDTLKPGLIQYDIGDCLRSCCNAAGEEAEDWEKIAFDLDLCQAILSGYLPAAQPMLDEADYGYLYDSLRLIAFELGLRFFTDYLEGDVYFKVRRPEHNLHRALVQFQLAQSIELQAAHIQAIIHSLR